MEGYRSVLLAKLHGITVSEANVAYEGSLVVPEDILLASGMKAAEQIHVWNVTTGARFETYIIAGPVGSRHFSVNGAAAHLAKKGDVIIVATFGSIPAHTIDSHAPTVIFFNSDNTMKECRPERV